jgi:hypothetical protein
MTDTESGIVRWRPRQPGLKWHGLRDIESPRGTAVTRLAQMRQISATFAATEDFKASSRDETTSRYQLRLLPRALYRYADEESGVIDGSVFAFVHGTDPEAFLVLEAIDRDGERSWRYALAPMTCWAVQVTHNDVEVWSVPERLNDRTVEANYHLWRYRNP